MRCAAARTVVQLQRPPITPLCAQCTDRRSQKLGQYPALVTVRPSSHTVQLTAEPRASNFIIATKDVVYRERLMDHIDEEYELRDYILFYESVVDGSCYLVLSFSE